MRLNTNLLVSATFLFILTIMVPTIMAANNDAPITPALRTVLELTEQTFITPGTSINQVSGSDPIMFATFVGLIMQRQKVQAYQGTDASNVERLGVLRDEVLELLAWVAGELQYRDPQDGSRLPAAKLQVIFGKAYNGDYNQSFIENSGFDPATVDVPYMISQVPLPRKPGGGGDSGDGEHGRLQLKDNNEINLLDTSVIGGATSEIASISGDAVGTGLFKVDKQICPDRAPAGLEYDHSLPDSLAGTFTIKHTKTNSTQCGYYSNGLLSHEFSFITEKHSDANIGKHGIYLTFDVSEEGKRFLHRIDHYRNGKKHGKSVGNKEFTYSGGFIGKDFSRMYVNGVEHGPGKEWGMTASGVSFLQNENNISNDKRHGVQIRYSEPDKRGKSSILYKQVYNNGVKQNEVRFIPIEQLESYLKEDWKLLDKDTEKATVIKHNK